MKKINVGLLHLKNKDYYKNMINLEKIQKEKPILELLNFSLVNIDKPAEITSFDVVNHINKKLTELGVKKAGHLGTLDPMVTGVLPICINSACKIQEFFMHRNKTYVGAMQIHQDITKEKLEQEMKKFLGKINQLPPVKSRVKRQIRQREIISFKLINFNEKTKIAEFITEVEAGTYIRKLIHDLGLNINGAHMASLRRIRAGLFTDKDKNFITLEQFDKIIDNFKKDQVKNEKKLREILIPAEIIIKLIPYVEVDEKYEKKVLNGCPIFKEMLDKKIISELIENKNNTFAVFLNNKLVQIAKKTEINENPEIFAKPLVVFN